MGLLHLWVRIRTATWVAPPVGGLGPPRGGGGPMGASGERQASGNPRAPCEEGCERASIRTAAPGHPHGESCASNGRARWPRAASVRSCCDVLQAARGRRWELQPCNRTRANVWCPVDGAREGFSTSRRLGQSPWRLGERGRQRHRVGHTHLVRGERRAGCAKPSPKGAVRLGVPGRGKMHGGATAASVRSRCDVLRAAGAPPMGARATLQSSRRRGPTGQRARVSMQS